MLIKSLSIGFMGACPFSLIIFQYLIKNFPKLIVWAPPPRKMGRGMKYQNNILHQEAIKNSCTINTPNSLKEEGAFKKFKNYNLEIVIVASYGQLIPKNYLDIPKYGFINVHPSLLPRWRGASPIQRTLQKGDNISGVTIFQMDEGWDSGPIWLQQEHNIEKNITFKKLHDTLAHQGGKNLKKIIEIIINNNIKPLPQNKEGVCFAPKIKKEEGKIDFNLSNKEVYNQIIAFANWPVCYFFYKKERIKVYHCECTNHIGKPGEIIEPGIIACGKGAIKLIIIQRPGKNKSEPKIYKDFWSQNDLVK